MRMRLSVISSIPQRIHHDLHGSLCRTFSKLAEVTVTQHSMVHRTGTGGATKYDDTLLVDGLLETTSLMIDPHGSNIVAYSGGVDSSLVAALVQRSFSSCRSTRGGSTTAVLGVSAAVPARQLETARRVAQDVVRMPLLEIPTWEGRDPTYVRNQGEACLSCKTHLYSTLRSVADHAVRHRRRNNHTTTGPSDDDTLSTVVLFNGTNKDDTTDPTRLGLIAADRFFVRSPLRHVTKDEVRRAARHVGLPNWNHAASPCLRSRLALGVEATTKHLKMVEEGEDFVRRVLDLDVQKNLRVRLLSGGRAGIELDEDVLEGSGEHHPQDHGVTTKVTTHNVERLLTQAGVGQFLEQIGFSQGAFVIRKFKSGAVAGAGGGPRN